jgi:hypothetical protein
MAVPHAAAALLSAVLLSQAPATPGWLKPPSRVTATATLESPRRDAANTLTVAVEVTPAAGIHVYAPGNKDYIAVELRAVPQLGVTPGRAEYPPAEPLVFGALKEVVRVYARPFRIRLPLVVDGAPNAARLQALELRYQACTDRVCFPPATLPLSVALPR